MWSPNQAQSEVIRTLDGPLLVISCPGSGKTTVLLHRIEALIRSGKDPRKILMVTFGKAAADDMAQRCRDLFGRRTGVEFSTIHALCLRILKDETKLDPKTLLDDSEINEWFHRTLSRIPTVADAFETSRAVQAELTSVRNNNTDLAAYRASSLDAAAFRQIAANYAAWKKTAGRFDYDDMLIRCRELLLTNKRVLRKWQMKWDYIQCDEYQDTNGVQRDILLALSARTKNFCAVGDDDQSIYAFRGANSSIMLHFTDDFPGAKIIRMGTNYRSAQEIVDYASCCIRHNHHRFEKEFQSSRGAAGIRGSVMMKAFSSKAAEDQAILSDIRRLHASRIPYHSMAVLVRQNRQASSVVAALAQADIPYYTPERVPSMYEDWCFRDIQAYLALAMGTDPDHETLYLNRILNRPVRYLSPAWFQNVPFQQDAMLEAAMHGTARSGKEYWQVTEAQTSILNWFHYFGPGRINGNTAPSVVFDRLAGAHSIHYDRRIASAAKFANADVEEYMEMFRTLKEDALRFQTVNEWLTHAEQVALLTREARKKENKDDAVRVMTMHRSKGLEWPVVFLPGVNASVLPGRERSMAEQEEERRVLYVAMTRAKDFLYISSTSTPSPFLDETAAAHEEMLHPHIPKKFAGAPVYHSTLGRGAVACYAGDEIRVRFPDKGIMRFPFPDAFLDHTLSYSDPAASKRT